ncbi:hypothetical protein [Actinoplanes teichomyceticus]|uniref:Uncharacterized protein n=1 Tax=Actinoplanes teichomyceticus TaxID=1867 RepID=A0A561WAV4_ACTTI|nr:hypothetical protein [Actinoplanes teichomyceticus]TWG20998.1 hypothetical protein FHX34_103527 [Actinoplanes teichomyceticus]GIF14818.1 hypothetical protein Ate01nite_48500 [Actinoplanes teichomyceticus]
MIEPTGEMVQGSRRAWAESMALNNYGVPVSHFFDMTGIIASHRAAVEAVLAIVERDLRAQIAYRIRAELVCCDVYDRDHDTERAGKTHSICFWGEAAARIALDTNTP